ncbi:MAG: class I SAM-dependent RNA methyltransferase [Oscillospiraceae bacterium]|nr:class I SAM-dependent RNA methyltransferase [Oscillospiraceae bacterium]
MINLNFTAPCHFGLEKTLQFEIKRAGGENITVTDGRILFEGSPEVLIRANISCSVAERIGVVLARFRAESFDDVYDNLKTLPLGDFLEKDAAFPVVKGQSVNSKLTSIPALQRTVKKALAEAMSRIYKTSTLPETGAVYPIRFFLYKDEMTVFFDSSGEGLHKRGYREKAGAAPIKETLAAGIIDIAKIRQGEIIIDPFCGSGTILIESVFKALNIPPCISRSFISEKWGFIPANLWSEQRELLRTGIKKDAAFEALGFDIDEACAALTLENAKKAGVADYIKAEKRAIKDFKFPESAEPCKIITNPPYAERMLEKADTERIYRDMGVNLTPLNDNKLYVITSDENFEAYFGQKAAKNRKLYNGMLMCRLYLFTANENSNK